ncbi:MAG: hypothetical protein LBT79_08065 [Elusimicrobiota bacterium]|jgi:hypothetical protein|nr:hypothetical protein [Elusimicrobiota bacterium]
MREIRFQAEIKNGMIEIPKQYIGQIPASVDVFVLERKNYKKQITDADFKAIRLDTRNWKFNHEEANKRPSLIYTKTNKKPFSKINVIETDVKNYKFNREEANER